jgi:NNP family nitrate/nitrite transporter-like MFS transporter
MWKLEDWQYPCYNIKNGRCNAILKWNKSYKLIYEEQTKNIIPILSLKRPHSRSFYLSLCALILSFCGLFNFNSIYLFQYDISIDNLRIDNVILFSSAALTRFHIGLISDRYGIRLTYSVLLLFSGMIGILKLFLIQYTIIRRVLTIFYGILGGSFVLSEIWVIIMFDTSILGLVTGIIGGFGNFGSILVFLINSYLPNIYYFIWVYVLMIILSFIIYKYSDDCPYGNYNEYTNNNLENTITITSHDNNDNNDNNLENTSTSHYSNDNNINIENIINDIEFNFDTKCNSKIFILALIYLYSFGLELTLYSNLILLKNVNKIYMFSISNIICRPVGGYISDIQYKHFKIIGKIKTMFFFQICTLIISNITLELNFKIMLLSCFNNLLQGSIIGIIPHINSKNIGFNFGIISGFGIIGGIIGNILLYYLTIEKTLIYITIYNFSTLILNIFCLL